MSKVDLEISGAVAVLRLDNPPVNSLGHELRRSIVDALARAEDDPAVACRVLEWAIQVRGGAGVSQDVLLAHADAGARSLRLADRPDEVHRAQVGKLELSRYRSA